MPDAVGATSLLGLHVEDEIQAQGRVAAEVDPAATGLPGTEGEAPVAAGVLRLAAPRCRGAARERLVAPLLGPAPLDTGP